MPLAFAPFLFWPLAILSPMVLFHLLSKANTPRQVFWLSWVYALGYFGFGVYWIYNSLHVYGHAPAILAAALTLLMIMTLSTFVATALYLYYRLIKANATSWLIWLLPPIWFSMEWFKGWVLTGFPWLSVGYAHVSSPLSGYAPIFGVYGVGMLSVLLSLLLSQSLKQKKVVCPLLLVGIPLLGYGLQQLDWTSESKEPLMVTMVQGNIAQEMKWRRSERSKILQIYWNASSPHWDSDLLVWPEAAIPGRSEDLEQSVLEPMSTKAAKQQSNLLTGVLVSDAANNSYHNSMIMLGEEQGQYHKRHLVPFGEFYPFRELLAFMRTYIRIPMSDMTPGPQHQPLMSVNGIKLGVSICYEDVFSRDINLDLPEANILVNTSNDAWFGDSLAPHQHLQIAQMRSLETGRPMVRSTNTGQSAFIDYRGRIMTATEQFKLQTLTTSLQGRSGSTPFLWFARVQPWLAWLILLVSVGLLIWQNKARNKSIAGKSSAV